MARGFFAGLQGIASTRQSVCCPLPTVYASRGVHPGWRAPRPCSSESNARTAGEAAGLRSPLPLPPPPSLRCGGKTGFPDPLMGGEGNPGRRRSATGGGRRRNRARSRWCGDQHGRTSDERVWRRWHRWGAGGRRMEANRAWLLRSARGVVNRPEVSTKCNWMTNSVQTIRKCIIILRSMDFLAHGNKSAMCRWIQPLAGCLTSGAVPHGGHAVTPRDGSPDRRRRWLARRRRGTGRGRRACCRSGHSAAAAAAAAAPPRAQPRATDGTPRGGGMWEAGPFRSDGCPPRLAARAHLGARQGASRTSVCDLQVAPPSGGVRRGCVVGALGAAPPPPAPPAL